MKLLAQELGVSYSWCHSPRRKGVGADMPSSPNHSAGRPSSRAKYRCVRETVVSSPNPATRVLSGYGSSLRTQQDIVNCEEPCMGGFGAPKDFFKPSPSGMKIPDRKSTRLNSSHLGI